MNLKIHAYNLDIVIVRCNRATIYVIARKVSMNLKFQADNLETVIVRCNGATIFVIALKI